MFIKRMNKRGQGISTSELIMLIAGVVIVAVLILGVTGNLNWVFGLFKLAPAQDLQVVASGCELAAKQGLDEDYCYTFKEVEINGKRQYVSCEDPRIVVAIDEDLRNAIECDASTVDSAKKDLCTNKKLKDTDLINNVAYCVNAPASKTCIQANGLVVDTAGGADCEAGKVELVFGTDFNVALKSNEICCRK